MKGKSLFVKLITIFFILFAVFISVGASSFIINQLKTSDKINDDDKVIDDGDTVTLSFKYAVCESIEKTEYEKIEIKSGTTNTKDDFNSFFTYIRSITKKWSSIRFYVFRW